MKKKSLAFIGSAGVPNRYGGFESFLESCGPIISLKLDRVLVTCDSSIYDDKNTFYHGMERVFVSIKANGWKSVFHDLMAFVKVFGAVDCIVVLGVSGGIWFPFFRILSDVFNKKLIVNIDGVEWRRNKFGIFKRLFLWFCDRSAQLFSHHVIYDNEGLRDYVLKKKLNKSSCIPYSGDYDNFEVKCTKKKQIGSALTICRIEPENNIELLIEGFLKSNLLNYSIIGNWDNSVYGIKLKEKYSSEKRINLLPPIYDKEIINNYRAQCEVYLHGHSVGGTNPSLVEMLFFDCHIFCLDVVFNKFTAEDSAAYFSDSKDLSNLINNRENFSYDRRNIREKYTRKRISDQYLKLIV